MTRFAPKGRVHETNRVGAFFNEQGQAFRAGLGANDIDYV